MEKFEEFQAFNVALSSGTWDDYLEMIESIIKRRREFIADSKLVQLKVGDRITISHTVTPKMLAGVPCEVTGFAGDKVQVKLLRNVSRKWTMSTVVTLPKSLIGETIL